MPRQIKNLDHKELEQLDSDDLKNVYRTTKESIRNFLKKGRDENDKEIIRKMETIKYIEDKLNIHENKKFTILKCDIRENFNASELNNSNLSLTEKESFVHLEKLLNQRVAEFQEILDKDRKENEKFREEMMLEKTKIKVLYDELDKRISNIESMLLNQKK